MHTLICDPPLRDELPELDETFCQWIAGEITGLPVAIAIGRAIINRGAALPEILFPGEELLLDRRGGEILREAARSRELDRQEVDAVLTVMCQNLDWPVPVELLVRVIATK